MAQKKEAAEEELCSAGARERVDLRRQRMLRARQGRCGASRCRARSPSPAQTLNTPRSCSGSGAARAPTTMTKPTWTPPRRTCHRSN
eukprot:1988258-Rhodomonas_salina.1